MPKVAILGAGSIGCFVGISWIAAGLDVSLIGRPNIGETLAQSGGKISDGEFCVTVAAEKIDFHETPETLRDADVIALTVKMTGDAEAAAQILRHARPGTLVVSLQNGVDNAARLSAMLPGFPVIDGMVPFNVIRPSPAHFKKASSGNLMIGSDPRLEALFEPVTRSGALEFRDDMRAVKWAKLLLNLNNGLSALSGLTIYDQLSKRPWRKLMAAAQRECLAVMKAEGITPARITPLPPDLLPGFLSTPDWLFNRTGLKMMKVDRNARSSMAMDFASGRRTEIDYLNGAVVDLAARHGIACPVNRTIVRLVKQAEAGGRKVWTPEEIRAELEKL